MYVCSYFNAWTEGQWNCASFSNECTEEKKWIEEDLTHVQVTYVAQRRISLCLLDHELSHSQFFCVQSHLKFVQRTKGILSLIRPLNSFSHVSGKVQLTFCKLNSPRSLKSVLRGHKLFIMWLNLLHFSWGYIKERTAFHSTRFLAWQHVIAHVARLKDVVRSILINITLWKQRFFLCSMFICYYAIKSKLKVKISLKLQALVFVRNKITHSRQFSSGFLVNRSFCIYPVSLIVCEQILLSEAYSQSVFDGFVKLKISCSLGFGLVL